MSWLLREPSWSRRCSTETIFSIQGKETDFVRDTTDTEWCGSDGGAVEYEPASEPEDDGPLAGDSSGHSDNDIITTKVIEVSVGDDGELQLADSELSESSSDSEMDLHDYWLCAHCRAQNNNPLYRYCEKCFTERKNFFPPRPKRKRKRTRVEPATLPRTLSQDSGVETAANSQELSQNDFGQCSQNSESILVKNSQTSTPNNDLLKTHLKRRRESGDTYSKRIKTNLSDSETDSSLDSSRSASSKSNLRVKSVVRNVIVKAETESVSGKALLNIDTLGKTDSDSEANIDSIRTKSTTLLKNIVNNTLVKTVSDSEANIDSIRSKSTTLLKNIDNNTLVQTVSDSEANIDSIRSKSTTLLKNIDNNTLVKTVSDSDANIDSIRTKSTTLLNIIDKNTLVKTVSDSEANIDSIRSKSTLINDVEVRSIVRMASDTETDAAPTRNKSIFNDNSEVMPLVKMVSDPALTVEEAVDLKLTKKAIINTLKEKLDVDAKDNLCMVCLVEPKSGVFVHGRIAHICCCYKCAVKVWSKAKRCPVCNCKVSNVLKAVVM